MTSNQEGTAAVAAGVDGSLLPPDPEDPFPPPDPPIDGELGLSLGQLGQLSSEESSAEGSVTDVSPKIGAGAVTVAKPHEMNPANAEPHQMTDMELLSKICSVDPTLLSVDECRLTDQALLQMQLNPLKELCRKCPYVVVSVAANGKSKSTLKHNLSMSGNKDAVVGRVLAWFFKFREELNADGDPLPAGKAPPPFNDSGSFSAADDARLIEILTDPTLAEATSHAFKAGRRTELDAADSSLVDKAWNEVIAGYFNNFEGYKSPHRFASPNDILFKFDPNKPNMCRRSGIFLKSRAGTLRSIVTIIHNNWKKSGHNDPDEIENFVNLTKPIEQSAYYFWKRLHNGGQGNDVAARRLLRLLDKGVDSLEEQPRDPQQLMDVLSGKNKQSVSNANDGGAIARAASLSRSNSGAAATGKSAGVAESLHAAIGQLADPAARRAGLYEKYVRLLRENNEEMDSTLEAIDPLGNGSNKPSAFINRKRKRYRQLRREKAFMESKLEAIRNGQVEDDSSDKKVPAEEELQTDEEEAYYLHDI